MQVLSINSMIGLNVVIHLKQRLRILNAITRPAWRRSPRVMTGWDEASHHLSSRGVLCRGIPGTVKSETYSPQNLRCVQSQGPLGCARGGTARECLPEAFSAEGSPERSRARLIHHGIFVVCCLRDPSAALGEAQQESVFPRRSLPRDPRNVQKRGSFDHGVFLARCLEDPSSHGFSG
jgi:hypothetical protein